MNEGTVVAYTSFISSGLNYRYEAIYYPNTQHFGIILQGATQREIVGSAHSMKTARDQIDKAVHIWSKNEVITNIHRWTGNDPQVLRPEVIDLLREHYPIGTKIKIVASTYQGNIGIEGKLIQILDTGHFEVEAPQMNHMFAYAKNTFQIISD